MGISPQALAEPYVNLAAHTASITKLPIVGPIASEQTTRIPVSQCDPAKCSPKTYGA